MKHLVIVVTIGLIFLNNCANNEQSYPSDYEIMKAFNVVLDSAIKPTYESKIRYDIRGNFNFEYDTSLILKSLECLDSIINEGDLRYIIDQYNNLKGKEVDGYINNEKYIVKQGAKYKPEDSIDYQFYLSSPLFTLDKQYFITFCIGTAVRINSFADGFYFLFINEDNEWYLHSIIKSDYTTPKQISSEQSHSFIPVR